MKRSASKIIGLALLLLVGCGAAGGPLAENEAEASFLELEETDWQAVSIDAGDFGMTEQPIGDPGSYGGSASLPLDKLIAFALASDGAASEDLFDELRQRFLEAPNTVLIYLTLMGEQETSIAGWEPVPTAELVCQYIASTDAAMYGGTEEFTQTLASCRETYPEGRIAELLDVMEREHAAGMERLEEAVRAYQAHIDAQT